ncbi:MAG: polysaccharide biosynthesis/export family protein [Acidobacteria bacterium]|nr:polysaccharide biosynthesis/export family protein [Acidobacteriota bacterium]
MNRFTFASVLVLCAAAAFAGTDSKGKPDTQPAKPAVPAPAAVVPAVTPAAAPAVAPDYQIGPEDVITVSVWKEPELSAQVAVRPDGKVSLPLLGDVQASGFTPISLGTDITERLKKFVEQPNVTVVVNQINSRRYFVMGEAGRPGAYPLYTNITILQAISMAGGFNQFANVKGIYLMRTENGQVVKHPFNYKQVVKGNANEQNLELKPGDTIVIP